MNNNIDNKVKVLLLLAIVVVVAIVTGTESKYRDKYEDMAGRITYLCQHEDCDVTQETAYTAYTHIPSIEEDDYQFIKQTGVWIYYSDQNYQGDSVSVIVGSNIKYTMPYPIKSVRYAGSSLCLQSPTLTLYSGPWFTGDEYYIELGEQEEDVMIPHLRDFTNRTQSIIVTGGEFAVFQDSSFTGHAMTTKKRPACSCVMTTHKAPHDDGVYSAGFYQYLNMTSVTEVGSVCGFCPEVCEETYTGKYMKRCPVVSSVINDPCVEPDT